MRSEKINTEFRPNNLSSFFGQTKIVNYFINNPDWPEKATTILFHSKVPGVGKTTLARIIAGIYTNNGTIIELDAAQNSGVDEIRNLLDSLRYAPIGGSRAIILDEAHLITNSAGSALLKTLEEPPDNTLFIFCTTNINKILPTIVSRSLSFELNPFTTNELLEYAEYYSKAKSKTYEHSKLLKYAKDSKGSIRTFINLLEADQSDILEEINFIDMLNDIISKKNIYHLLDKYNTIDFYSSGIESLNEKIINQYKENSNSLSYSKKIQKLLLNTYILADQLPKHFIKQMINITLIEIMEILDE